MAKKSVLDWVSRIEALGQKNEWQGILKLTQQWVRSEQESAIAWSFLGIAYSGLKQYDRAIDAYRVALRIQPEDANTWDELGDAYINLNQYDHAVQAYLESLRIEPENATVWYFLGTSYYSQGQRDKMREIYPVLRRLDPAMAEKCFNSYVLP